MSIFREVSGHTPASKKRSDMAHRASSLKACNTIQETIAADMLSLHAKSSQGRLMAVLTPNGDSGNADGDCGDAESDDDDYSPNPVTPPKTQDTLHHTGER